MGGDFLNISFDQTVQALESALVRCGELSGVNSITIIRDIYGKISLFFEGDSNQFAGRLDKLKNECVSALGNYWGGQILYEKTGLKPIQNAVIEAIKAERTPRQPDSAALRAQTTLQLYFLERAVAKKAWLQAKPERTAPWTYEEANGGTAPKIISFYSFKGGMGRTTAMAGVGLLLAKEGKKVILIDTDVEAPGLASLFFPESAIEYGVLDYFLDKNVDSAVSVSDYVLPYDLSEVLEDCAGTLSVVPAGSVNEQYLSKLARMDLQEYRKDSLRDLMSKLLNDLRAAYSDTDYILIDARAGFHDLGGVALSQIPHGAVLFGNDSDQSWSGIQQAVRCAARSQPDTMFLIMAASMTESRTSEQFHSALAPFIRRSHALFTDEYYGDSYPSLEAEDEPHYPVAIEYNRSLQQNLHLYPIDGVSEETRRAQAALLMSESYQKIVERIKGNFE